MRNCLTQLFTLRFYRLLRRFSSLLKKPNIGKIGAHYRYSVLRKRKVNVVILTKNFLQITIFDKVVRILKEQLEFSVLQFIVKNVCFAVLIGRV